MLSLAAIYGINIQYSHAHSLYQYNIDHISNVFSMVTLIYRMGVSYAKLSISSILFNHYEKSF